MGLVRRTPEACKAYIDGFNSALEIASNRVRDMKQQHIDIMRPCHTLEIDDAEFHLIKLLITDIVDNSAMYEVTMVAIAKELIGKLVRNQPDDE